MIYFKTIKNIRIRGKNFGTNFISNDKNERKLEKNEIKI